MHAKCHKERVDTKRLCRAITARGAQVMRVTTAALIVNGALGGFAPSRAQEILGAELRLDEIEKAFWVCDYAATISVINIYNAITCSHLTEALRRRKFDGDFAAMLAWWRQNKDAEYQNLSKGGGTSLPRLAPSMPPR